MNVFPADTHGKTSKGEGGGEGVEWKRKTPPGNRKTTTKEDEEEGEKTAKRKEEEEDSRKNHWVVGGRRKKRKGEHRISDFVPLFKVQNIYERREELHVFLKNPFLSRDIFSVVFPF